MMRVINPQTGRIRTEAVQETFANIEAYRKRMRRIKAVREATDNVISIRRAQGQSAVAIAHELVVLKKHRMQSAQLAAKLRQARVDQRERIRSGYGYDISDREFRSLRRKDRGQIEGTYDFERAELSTLGRLGRDIHDTVLGAPASFVETAKAGYELADMVDAYWMSKLGVRDRHPSTTHLEGVVAGIEQGDPLYAIGKGVVEGDLRGGLREAGRRISEHPLTAAEFLPAGRAFTAAADVARHGSRAAARARGAAYVGKDQGVGSHSARTQAARDVVREEAELRRLQRAQKADAASVEEVAAQRQRVKAARQRAKPQGAIATKQRQYSRSGVVRLVEKGTERVQEMRGRDSARKTGRAGARLRKESTQLGAKRVAGAGLSGEADVGAAIIALEKSKGERGHGTRAYRGLRSADERRLRNAAIRFRHTEEVSHGSEIEDLQRIADALDAHIDDAAEQRKDTSQLVRNRELIERLAEDWEANGEDSHLARASAITHGEGGTQEISRALDDELVRLGYITEKQARFRRKAQRQASHGNIVQGRSKDQRWPIDYELLSTQRLRELRDHPDTSAQLRIEVDRLLKERPPTPSPRFEERRARRARARARMAASGSQDAPGAGVRAAGRDKPEPPPPEPTARDLAHEDAMHAREEPLRREQAEQDGQSGEFERPAGGSEEFRRITAIENHPEMQEKRYPERIRKAHNSGDYKEKKRLEAEQDELRAELERRYDAKFGTRVAAGSEQTRKAKVVEADADTRPVGGMSVEEAARAQRAGKTVRKRDVGSWRLALRDGDVDEADGDQEWEPLDEAEAKVADAAYLQSQVQSDIAKKRGSASRRRAWVSAQRPTPRRGSRARRLRKADIKPRTAAEIRAIKEMGQQELDDTGSAIAPPKGTREPGAPPVPPPSRTGIDQELYDKLSRTGSYKPERGKGAFNLRSDKDLEQMGQDLYKAGDLRGWRTVRRVLSDRKALRRDAIEAAKQRRARVARERAPQRNNKDAVEVRRRFRNLPAIPERLAPDASPEQRNLVFWGRVASQLESAIRTLEREWPRARVADDTGVRAYKRAEYWLAKLARVGHDHPDAPLYARRAMRAYSLAEDVYRWRRDEKEYNPELGYQLLTEPLDQFIRRDAVKKQGWLIDLGRKGMSDEEAKLYDKGEPGEWEAKYGGDEYEGRNRPGQADGVRVVNNWQEVKDLGSDKSVVLATRSGGSRGSRPFANWVARSKKGDESIPYVRTADEAVSRWYADRVSDDAFMEQLWQLKGKQLVYMTRTRDVAHVDVLRRVQQRMDAMDVPKYGRGRVVVARMLFEQAYEDWDEAVALAAQQRINPNGLERPSYDTEVDRVYDDQGEAIEQEADVPEASAALAHELEQRELEGVTGTERWEQIGPEDRRLALAQEAARAERAARARFERTGSYDKPERPPREKTPYEKWEEQRDRDIEEWGQERDRERRAAGRGPRKSKADRRREAFAAVRRVRSVHDYRKFIVAHREYLYEAFGSDGFRALVKAFKDVSGDEAGFFNMWAKPRWVRADEVQRVARRVLGERDWRRRHLLAAHHAEERKAALGRESEIYTGRERRSLFFVDDVEGMHEGDRMTSESPVREGAFYAPEGRHEVEALAREKSSGQGFAGRSFTHMDMGAQQIHQSLLQQARMAGQAMLSNLMTRGSYHGKPVEYGKVDFAALERETGIKWVAVVARRRDQPEGTTLGVENPDADELFRQARKGDMVHVIPEVDRDVWKSMIARPRKGEAVLRQITRAWIGAVLPFSVAWHVGNMADQALRLLAMGPGALVHGSPMYEALERQLAAGDLPPQLQREILSLRQAHFQTQADVRRQTLADIFEKEESRAASVARALTWTTSKQEHGGYVPRLWAEALSTPRDFLFKGGGVVEQAFTKRQIGAHAAESYRQMVGTIADYETMARELALRWADDPDALDHFQREVLQTVGDWTLNRGEQMAAAAALPFVKWMENALKWTLWTVPTRHPNALIAAIVMAQMTREQRRMLGLEYWHSPQELYRMGMPKPRPIGTVVVGGQARYLGALFSVTEAGNALDNPPKWFADKLFPWIQGPAAAGVTGATLYDDVVSNPKRSVWDAVAAREDVKLIQRTIEAQGGGPVWLLEGSSPYKYRILRYEKGQPVIYEITGRKGNWKPHKRFAGVLGHDLSRVVTQGITQFLPMQRHLREFHLVPGTQGHWQISRRGPVDLALDPVPSLGPAVREGGKDGRLGQGWTLADEIRHSQYGSPFQRAARAKVERKRRAKARVRRVKRKGAKRFRESVAKVREGRRTYRRRAAARVKDFGSEQLLEQYGFRPEGTSKKGPTLEALAKPIPVKQQTRAVNQKQYKRYKARQRRAHARGELVREERQTVRYYDEQIERKQDALEHAQDLSRRLTPGFKRDKNFRPDGTKVYMPSQQELQREVKRLKRRRARIVRRAASPTR